MWCKRKVTIFSYFYLYDKNRNGCRSRWFFIQASFFVFFLISSPPTWPASLFLMVDYLSDMKWYLDFQDTFNTKKKLCGHQICLKRTLTFLRALWGLKYLGHRYSRGITDLWWEVLCVLERNTFMNKIIILILTKLSVSMKIWVF